MTGLSVQRKITQAQSVFSSRLEDHNTQYLLDFPRAVDLIKAASFPYLSSSFSFVVQKIFASFHSRAHSTFLGVDFKINTAVSSSTKRLVVSMNLVKYPAPTVTSYQAMK